MGYILKRSPDTDQYLSWSTVCDAPSSRPMSREHMFEMLLRDIWMHRPDAERGVRPELLEEFRQQVASERQHAHDRVEAQLSRADRYGISVFYEGPTWDDKFWWRENVPDGVGEPVFDEETGEYAQGRMLTREQLFDAAERG